MRAKASLELMPHAVVMESAVRLPAFMTQEHHRRWKPSTAQNQLQQEKTESVLVFFAERKQKVAVNFKDI